MVEPVTTKLLMTPANARDLLRRNYHSNRPLSRHSVDMLVGAIKRGEWRTTHQGIAFNKKDELIDGQHRLTAIAEAGIPVEIMVTMDLEEDAYQAIDIGRKRSLSIILDMPSKVTEIGRLVASLGAETNNLTPDQVREASTAFSNEIAAVFETTQANTRRLATASVRAGAVVAIAMFGNTAYVTEQYHALVHHNFSKMTPVVQALYKQLQQGRVSRVGRSEQVDHFMRAVTAFDYSRRDQTTIRSEPLGRYAERVRKHVVQRCGWSRKSKEA